MKVPSVAVIIPVLDEVEFLLQQLTHLGRHTNLDELIVVSAGDEAVTKVLDRWRVTSSESPTAPLNFLRAARGRSRQMNAGAAMATSDIFIFLHVDTQLPDDAVAAVRAAISAGWVWGRFDVRLSGARVSFRVIESLMNWRATLTSIATGDQAMFVRRDVFWMLGGFARMPLMEDIDLSARLKSVGPPARLRGPATTSSRRWEERGVIRTVLRMWTLRALYACGVSTRRLERWYS